ncbi:hypothetical protein LWC34_03970 [Kibdelosporangium philippinense]|uniref:Alkylhydroperoxidase AhpD family core domain-containing protein n=1 Tax=Kibdelosporangium philippinense TaxID=211113 RepID=A0ABS8Z838_9PSEU|nr:hypothetical protein [Kibdelosporangium philippinense]MCE7001992.1 hypothetical protein [Kibdelosporangium philippinense]
MRLSILDRGHRTRAMLFLKMTAIMSRVDNPDIVKTLLCRPGFLTRALLDLTVPAMRGPSYWTAGEREYLAMTTAQRYECSFCFVTHTELVRIAAHGEIDPDQPDSARPELQSIRRFLDAPDNADLVAGLPAQAVLEALHVGVVWNVVNRLALAFGFELQEGQLQSGTRALHRFGYRFPAFLLAEGLHIDRGGLIENLRHAVLDAPATTSPALRTSAATGGSLPEPWQSYTALVRDTPSRITDDTIKQLLATGHFEDEVFEMTAAAAVGAALHEFDTGRRAIPSGR